MKTNIFFSFFLDFFDKGTCKFKKKLYLCTRVRETPQHKARMARSSIG